MHHSMLCKNNVQSYIISATSLNGIENIRSISNFGNIVKLYGTTSTSSDANKAECCSWLHSTQYIINVF